MDEYTYSVNALQERVTKNVERHHATTLNAPVPVLLVIGDSESQVLLLDHVLGVANSNLDLWDVVRFHTDREDVALVKPVVGRAGDLVVDLLDHLVRHESERGAGISNGSVAAEIDFLAVDRTGLGRERPEPLRVVDLGPVDVLARLLDEVLVNEAEGVERLGILVTRAVEGRSEELGCFGDVVLLDHVFDRGSLGVSLSRIHDRVDLAPSETKEAIAGALGELFGHLAGTLDGLLLDGEAAQGKSVADAFTRCSGAVSVLYLPRLSGQLLERLGLLGVVDIVTLRGRLALESRENL